MRDRFQSMVHSVMSRGVRLPKRPEHPKPAYSRFLPTIYRGRGRNNWRPTGPFEELHKPLTGIVGCDVNPVIHPPINQQFNNIRKQIQGIKAEMYHQKSGNLEWEDYRFWIGAETKSSLFSKCRCCRRVVYGPDFRLKHKDDVEYPNCNTQLVDAYKLLNKERLCVVCDRPVWNKGTWGVPMCPGCIPKWMFGHREPFAPLFEALVEVKTVGKMVIP